VEYPFHGGSQPAIKSRRDEEKRQKWKKTYINLRGWREKKAEVVPRGREGVGGVSGKNTFSSGGGMCEKC